MARKKSSSPAPPELELIDAVNRLADIVNVLADIASRVRSDLDWIINNRAEFTQLGRDTIDSPDARSQVLRSSPLQPETIACSDCDVPSPASLAAALQEGWTELAPHQGESWNYIGLCPDCLESEYSFGSSPKKVATESSENDDRSEPSRPKDRLF
jgi:hypothetical protein